MSDIFLSYASKDRERARTLAQRLEQEGWSVWWDRKILPGKTFAKELKGALDAANCVVVLWSSTSVESEWVQNEASEGNRRHILVPAIIEENTAPPFEFQRIQAADIVGWENRHPGNELAHFIEAIKKTLNSDVSQQGAIDGPGRLDDGIHGADEAIMDPPGRRSFITILWQGWGRPALLVMVAGLSLMGLFKALYPQTSVTEALTMILILSVITGAGLNFVWNHWRRARTKK
jgi:hypothetical protein